MSESSFDIGDIEPAVVNLIDDNGTNEEQPTDGTPKDSAAPAEQPEVQAGDMASEQYKNLQAAFTKATQENSGLRNRLTELEARLAQPPAPTHQNSFDAPQQPQGPDDLDKAVEDYEELKPFAARIRQLEGVIERQNAAIEQSRYNSEQSQRSSNQNAHEQKILNAHPDAFEISGTPDFQGWVARQPGYIQEAIKTGPADHIIAVLSQYKNAPNAVSEVQKIAAPNIGTASVKTTNNTPPSFTGAEIAAMSDAEFIRRESEIQQAQMEGRVT